MGRDTKALAVASIALSVGIGQTGRKILLPPHRRRSDFSSRREPSLPPSPSFVHSTLWIVIVIDVDTKTLFPQIAIVIQPSIIHPSQVRPSVSQLT